MFRPDPSTHVPHALHGLDRRWPETNCWTDLWIEIVAALGREPAAMLGFTVTQDFEGDQATFFKVPTADLERLYGLELLELSIFDRLAGHVEEQTRRGRIVLVEADAFYLPDTRGITWRSAHSKTTIGITEIDPAARRLVYFHNAGLFALDGDDYDGIFGAPGADRDPAVLFPYVEFVKLPADPPRIDLVGEAVALLARHLARRPAENPFRAWAAAFPAHVADLGTRPPEWFHTYAFNLMRQYGANFELLAGHLLWLEANGVAGLAAEREAAEAIAETMKVMQFRLARAMARNRFDGLAEAILAAAEAWDRLIGGLLVRFPPA